MIDNNYLCFESAIEGKTITIRINKSSTLTSPPTLNYTIDDGSTWKLYSYGTSISLPYGTKCYWKGWDGRLSESTSKYISFYASGKVKASGNIMSLLDNTCTLTDLTGLNYCFYNFFSGVSNLVTAPELPATILSKNCYQRMFNGCSSLIEAPEIPAIAVDNYSCSNMFYNCTSLQTIQGNLNATTLGTYCYESMFYGCSNIESISYDFLPATNLKIYCYNKMFYGCSKLINAPNLPALTLATDCYALMFYGCSSLKRTPELPATTLAESCYWDMFVSCTSLTTIPDLPANEMYASCYREMFLNCTGIKISETQEGEYIKPYKIPSVGTITTEQTYWADNMFKNTGGTFKGTPLSNTTYYTPLNLDPENDYFYVEPTTRFDADIEFIIHGNNFSLPTLYYSTDNKTTWTKCEMEHYTIHINTGEKCYFAGDNSTFSIGNTKYISLQADNGIKIGGNIMSLVDSSCQSLTIPNSYCFKSLFEDCSDVLSSIDDLKMPATTLTDYCYSSMFQDCSSLTSIPSGLLPATTLSIGCYSSMFYNCTSLTSISSDLLPATTLTNDCYSSMFYNCNSLTLIPSDLLPATTLSTSCYQSMFYGCTSLISIPSGLLSATTLADYCYSSMFYNCNSLTSISSDLLPATTLTNYCYSSMFQGCSSLISIPSGLLPATTLSTNCYRSMFYGCSSLTSIPSDLLPATTLANYCYSGMFQGCSSLTLIPSDLLPATTLANYCYSGMFYNCVSLKVSSTKTGMFSREFRIPSSGTIPSNPPSNWNLSMFAATGGPFTGDPSINTTYYLIGRFNYDIIINQEDGILDTSSSLPGIYSYGDQIKALVTAKVKRAFNYYILKGYTRLEYIQSTGTQYIEIGTKVKAKSWVDITLDFSSYWNHNFMFGTWSDLSIGTRNNGTFVLASGGSEWNPSNIPLSINTKYRIIHGQYNTIINDDAKITGLHDNNITTDNIWLFCNNAYIWGSGYSAGKIYECKLYNGEFNNITASNLEYYFIPVIRHSDGEIGMLDLVNLKFYGNSGTGKFIGGPIYYAS